MSTVYRIYGATNAENLSAESTVDGPVRPATRNVGEFNSRRRSSPGLDRRVRGRRSLRAPWLMGVIRSARYEAVLS